MVPIFSQIIRKFGAFPVDREKRDVGAVLKAVDIAKEGKIVAMFPQGRRSEDIEKDIPKTGFLRIALSSRCSILPCSLYYESYFPRSRIFISYGKLVDVLKILKENEVSCGELDYKEIRSLTKNVWGNVLNLYKKQELEYRK